ncbi:MAG: diguanylate cyclase [Nitrospirae bacterium]|nr:diguanylate cyclase [Nitrospirota bacterium]
MISDKKEMMLIYQNGLAITSAKNITDVLSATLEKAMQLTESPAGSLALRERDEMVIVASRGLNSSLGTGMRWKLRPDGMTSFILGSRDVVEVQDITSDERFSGTSLLQPEIRSLLACPLRLNGGVVGILYLNDFRVREFSDSNKNLVLIFAMQAAQAIDKFRILDELYRVITDLDETTAYLKNVFDDSQDMIITTDSGGKIVEFSKGGERILGYARDEIVGMDASSLYVDGEERAGILKLLQGNNGAIFNHETRLLRKDGAPVDISLTISQLRDKLGKIIGTVGISKDITREKSLRAELRKANEELGDLNLRLEDKVMERTRELENMNLELIKSNKIKARFISNMSHELRTPLNSILGFSEILLEKTFGDLNEKQRRHVTNIFSSGKHLLQLVNNILDLAKIEAGKIELFLEDFEVRQAIDEVVMVMNSLAAKKSITIKTEVQDDVSVFNADKLKFKQILYNLVSNAIKFTPEGGVIGIRAGQVINVNTPAAWGPEGQQVLTITVWDKGIGIRPEDIDRIFEEFEQADSSMSRNFEGTGLGLSLTRKLVDLHGGQISVRSTYGEGSEFTFSLPSSRTDALVEAPGEDYLTAPAPLQETGEEAPLVLVVEDDLPTSEILTIHLTKSGYRVIHSYDGADAIQKAKELKPFAITLDVMLPKKDGWEVLQTLKADPATNNIPVLIHSIIDNRELAFALGASDYLIKPLDKSALLGKLGELSLVDRKVHLPITVLLISGDPETQESIYRFSNSSGFLFHTATAPEEGLELASVTKPHIIMIDINTCGIELIKTLKSNPATMNIPVFALTNRDLPMSERMDLTGQIERVLKKDGLMKNDLVLHLKDLEVLHPKRAGLIDELTGLFNHRYFHLRLAQEVSRAMRYKSPLTLLLIDIDHFGNYLKHKGEYNGNVILKKIADLLKRSLRASDILVRNGGDAFSVILPDTPMSAGLTLGRRFNALIHDYPFLYGEVQPKGRITASIGIARMKDHSPEDLIRCSEAALSAAIKKGGNAVEVCEEIE